ncbi:MAG TPA: histidinol dehydrogenase [Candidatus Eisenbacteria bacterium]|nr:histidinol dehydrogenase [Candidatus Eisenbacteria bacterium]
MRSLSGPAAAAIVARLAQRNARLDSFEPQVRVIVNTVRRKGDLALHRYAERWDGVSSNQPLRVSIAEIKAGWKSTSPAVRAALTQSAQNIRQFCEWQKPVAWTRVRNGISLGQLVIPLDSVGCYVPGGRHALVSTLLMTVIPAQVAGVREIRVVSPKPSAEILAACSMLGVRELYRVGGAQAIAALAYGTKTIRRVDKIVGPGNVYVTVAKKLVSFDCAIDLVAGPTEAVVLSELGNPKFMAADLVSQAEHDPEAISVFITASRKLADDISLEIKERVRTNPIAKESIKRRGAVLVARSRKQAREWANLIAPEHITVSEDDLPFIHNAGSIFIGDYSPQAAGDYASGPNHVLPTSGQARFRGGLSVLDFVKLITVQKLSRTGLQKIARTVECMAEIEGLQAHAESIRTRYANA